MLALRRASRADDPRITKGPYLQNVTSTSAVVMWETSAPASSFVDLSTASGNIQIFVGPRDAIIHEVRLDNLSAASPYRYRVRSGATASDEYRFRTAPGRNAPCTFAVFGDSRTQPDIFAGIAEGIRAKNPDFLLHTGDIVADGTKYEQWSPMFFDPARALIAGVPLFPALGNHERNSPHFAALFSLPNNERWYSFDWASAHFIALDSCGDRANWDANSEQVKWLERDLEATKAKWKFVYFHHPLYSSGNHGSSRPHREAWEAIFSKHEVDVVFQGHDHTYERTWRVYQDKRDDLFGAVYVVAGGGGAPLYDVTANDWTAFSRKAHTYTLTRLDPLQLRMETYDLNNALIDHLVITKDPVELPRLLEQAKEVRSEERLKAVQGLSDLAGNALLLVAPQLVGHPDIAVRRALAQGLNRVGLPHGIPHALRLLRGGDTVIKREVAQLLGKAADDRTAENAIPLLAERDTQTRIGAARALTRGKVVKAKSALAAALSDEEPLVRYYACFAFSKIAGPGDLGLFQDRLQDPSPLVRLAVAQAVGEAALRPAIPLLIAALADRAAKVKNAALASLRTMTKEDFGLDLARWRQWWEANGKALGDGRASASIPLTLS